jgi:hypothetical protein
MKRGKIVFFLFLEEKSVKIEGKGLDGIGEKKYTMS